MCLRFEQLGIKVVDCSGHTLIKDVCLRQDFQREKRNWKFLYFRWTKNFFCLKNFHCMKNFFWMKNFFCSTVWQWLWQWSWSVISTSHHNCYRYLHRHRHSCIVIIITCTLTLWSTCPSSVRRSCSWSSIGQTASCTQQSGTTIIVKCLYYFILFYYISFDSSSA